MWNKNNLNIVCLSIFLFFLSGCAAFFPARSYEISSPPGPQRAFRGIAHVHTVHSGDSEASFEDVVKTAKKSELDFVIITDHGTLEGRKHSRPSSLAGDPLLIVGTELTTASGHLLLLGIETMPPKDMSIQQKINWVKKRNGFVFLAHPTSKRTPWEDLDLENIDGIEVYNFAHDLYLQKEWTLPGRALLLLPKSFLRSFQKNPESGLELWDRLLESKKVSGLSAVDAHQRSLKAPPLKTQFQSTTIYTLIQNLSSEQVLKALAEGRNYFAFEAYGTAEGFSFSIKHEAQFYEMGDEFESKSAFDIRIQSSKKGKIHLIRNGQLVLSEESETLSYIGRKPGVYRVEIYQEERLWIASNPIYVR